MDIVKLLRVNHWIKNLFLFIPVFFAGELFYTNNLLNLIQGFVAFSFIASGVYILNDYKDIKNDKLHPEKKIRPLASGKVSIKAAFVIFFFLVATSFALAYFLNLTFFYILLVYFFINIGYTFGLKNISILDIFIVASGFLLRTLAGAVITGVLVSQWLMVMVFLLAVFLALAKRRDDILMNMTSGKVLRKSTQHYNLDFANSCLTMLSAVILVAYIMYSISQEVTERLNSDFVYVTSVFVMAGIMRYLQITLVENNSGSPTKILYSDLFLRITLLGWVLCFYAIIYLHKF
jgi:decaprenyl-phosphate phosphoribosyltransferase